MLLSINLLFALFVLFGRCFDVFNQTLANTLDTNSRSSLTARLINYASSIVLIRLCACLKATGFQKEVTCSYVSKSSYS